MKKIVRLTDGDLTNLVKRVINEGVIIELQPETAKTLKGRKGTFSISDDGKLYFMLDDGKRFELHANEENPTLWGSGY